MINKNTERCAVMALASIMSIRMLGLFMILPVFSVYAAHMSGATPTLIGLALGIYGLTQAALQIPFGMLSDHIGRKPIIYAGLLLLLIGSIVAANAHSIGLLLVGRALQGAGAVGSTVLALIADLTRDEFRSKAMAIMGLCIGSAFTLAMIIGPIISSWFHLAGIFWATALLAIVGMIVLKTAVPKPPKPITDQNNLSIKKRLAITLHNKKLLQLDWGIFSLHCILTAMFIAIPYVFFHSIALSKWQQVGVYLTVLVLAFMMALPLIIIAEKKRKMKPIFVGSIGTIALVAFLLSIAPYSVMLTGILLFLFFTAFTFLEATLPSWVSKIAPIRHKGAAMGVYSSSQFFGIFAGGALGGLIFSLAHISGVFLFCVAMALVWLIIALFMQQPPYLSTIIVSLSELTSEKESYKQLDNLPGIAEIAAVPDEGLLYIKIDKQKISENELRDVLRAGNLTA